ncbi:MAG: GWxTD domain-containing protein [Bacteroidales bacterium]|nr:GWxTD domain-containing protein [Bacteroidales bacterium]
MKILNKHILYTCLITISMMLVGACVSPKTNVNNNQTSSYKHNFSSIYNPAETNLHPEIKVFTESDTSAMVFFKINIDELSLGNKNTTDTTSELIIKYALRNVNNFEITDSAVIIYNLNIKINKPYLGSYFRIKLKPNSKNKLIVGFILRNKKGGSRIIVDIDNLNDNHANKFLLEELNSNSKIKYNNYVNKNNIYRISSQMFKNTTIRFEYYKYSDCIVIPPYFTPKSSDDIIVPDSVFTYRIGDTITFAKHGFYVMKTSQNKPGFKCFINPRDSYPEISILSDMLEPLCLFATNKDIKQIRNAKDLKIAIDNYWLSLSKNQKFAKEQIRVFYNRVSLANKFFSDYREGWKTDRGLLYVILGPPTIVNISANGEEWFYGENPDVAGVLFQFDEVNSLYAEKTILLRRDERYQTIWAQAVNTWRNGRIFTITKN